MGSLVSSARDHAAYEQLLEQARLLESLLLEMITVRRASADPTATDVLNLLIHAHDEHGVALTDEELIGQAAILFSAAHLTTANSLSWTLFLLAQHPEAGNELVRRTLGQAARRCTEFSAVGTTAVSEPSDEGEHALLAGLGLFAADQHRAE